MSVTIVWPKMLGGDDEKAARETSKMFDDPRVHHFYDHNRIVGTEFAKTVFKNFNVDAPKTVPKEHRLYDVIQRVSKIPPEKKPSWDIAMFYKAGTKWEDSPPEPAAWSKQIAFFGESGDGDGHSGYFWANSFKSDLKKSDWYDEIRNQLKQLSRKSTN